MKFSELTLDTFRMLQCLEWEPSGSFYQSSGNKIGASGPNRTTISQDIVDHTLPPNPRKVVLYHPSMTHLIAVCGLNLYWSLFQLNQCTIFSICVFSLLNSTSNGFFLLIAVCGSTFIGYLWISTWYCLILPLIWVQCCYLWRRHHFIIIFSSWFAKSIMDVLISYHHVRNIT